MKKLIKLLIVIMCISESVVSVQARPKIRESTDLLGNTYKRHHGYYNNIDVRDNVNTTPYIIEWKRSDIDTNFSVRIKEEIKNKKEYEELNVEILALVTRYFRETIWYKEEIYTNPIYLLAGYNYTMKEYNPTYSDNNIFTNYVLDVERYFLDEEYYNRFTGFDFQELLFTYKTDDWKETLAKDTKKYKYGTIWKPFNTIVSREIMPIIPADYGRIFTPSAYENRSDLSFFNLEYRKEVGKWKSFSYSDRWNYADAYNYLLGGYNEFLLNKSKDLRIKTIIGDPENIEKDNILTGIKFMYSYVEKDFEILINEKLDEKLEYHYKYIDNLYDIILLEEIPKFRNQDVLITYIDWVCEEDTKAEKELLIRACEYLVLHARYGGTY